MGSPPTTGSPTKTRDVVLHPGQVRTIEDLRNIEGPVIPVEAAERGYMGTFESEADIKDTVVIWTRFPTPIAQLLGEIARDPDYPYGGRTVAVIRHAVYEFLLALYEEKQDEKKPEIINYLRSKGLLAKEAFRIATGDQMRLAVYSVETLIGKAVDYHYPEDVHKELERLDELYRGTKSNTWKAELRTAIRRSPMIRKGVEYLVRAWSEGTGTERKTAAGWEAWWENISG